MTIISSPSAHIIPVDCAGFAAEEAIEHLAWNALTVASLRMLNKPCVPRSERGTARTLQLGTLHCLYAVPADSINDWRLLEGAWARLPIVARRYGLDLIALGEAMDEYVRGLLAYGLRPAEGDAARLLAKLTA